MKFLASLLVTCATIPHSLELVSANAPTSAGFASLDQSNASREEDRARKFTNSVAPANAVTQKWRYGHKTKDYSGCTTDHDSKPWIMLNAYQSGGERSYYWIFMTQGVHIGTCLKDWTYYAKDGKYVLAQIEGYSTIMGDKVPWCPLPRYRPKGKQGYEWEYCKCDE
jgi:hypothetical protein